MRSLSFFSLAVTALASPVLDERQSSRPTVTIASGTVTGSNQNGIHSFKGIPFADPPVGSLRLKAPRPLSKSFGTLDATKTPRSCPQQFFDVDETSFPEIGTALLGQLLNSPVFQAASNAGEDCLTINIQRPSNANKNSKLPVVFWLYGGGFEFGSTQTYDGSSIIKKSVELKSDVIYVAANYRVSGFGFLAGKELQSEGNTNLGLRDQRLALQWVADNIATFGGDPNKVTIWGESAGSISVFDQTIINGGDTRYKGKPLFRGAVMNSGAAVPTLPVNHPKSQAVYDQVVRAAGCSGQSDTLACLRSISYEKFLNAVSTLPSIISYDSLNLAFLPRPDPSNSFFPLSPDEAAMQPQPAGVPYVPVIIGDQQDEGTLFALPLSNVTTGKFTDYFANYFPDTPRQVVADYVDLYPDNPSAGSPFGTGPLNEIYPGFKKNAAILGDATFTLGRRAYLKIISGRTNAWTYLSSYFDGVPVVSTAHATDILAIYFGLTPPATNDILPYYISFFNHLDPNKLGGRNWAKWTDAGREMIGFKSLGRVEPLKDNFREEAYQYLLNNIARFRV